MKNKHEQKQKQIIWVDSIRVVACFMVVFLHSAAPLLYMYNKIGLSNWFVGNIYDSLVRVCVPLFFMISGFLLLQKDESLTVYFTKRFSKLFIPLVFWSVFFVLWKNIFELGRSPSLSDFSSLILTPSYYHLWFLYALIGLYLFIPILRKVAHNSDDTLLNYYVLIWFLAVSIIPLIQKFIGIDSRIDLNSISGFIGYFVLGLILGKKQISTKVFYISTAVYFMSVILTIIATYVFTSKNGGIFVGYFYGYLSPHIVVASAACFIAIKYITVNTQLSEKPLFQEIIKTISSCSFGIYLVHTVFLFLLKNGTLGVELSAFTGESLFYVPLTAMIVFLLSFLLVFVLKKIPVIKLVV